MQSYISILEFLPYTNKDRGRNKDSEDPEEHHYEHKAIQLTFGFF